MEFFAAARPRGGNARFALALGGLRIDIEGLDDDLCSGIAVRFKAFAASPDVPTAMTVEVRRENREYFIDPPRDTEIHPVLLDCDGHRVRFLSYQAAGWFDLAEGKGQLVISRGRYEPPAAAVENYVRVAVGWASASCGGALVHAASAVLDGKGYLFYGESGAGKSTLSAVNRRARVLSDDLSLVLPRQGGGIDLVGTPFRGTFGGGPAVVGAFPLAAGFRIVKSDRAEVREVPRSIALAELVGNLPFVAEFFAKRPDLFERVERTFASVPLAHLHFRKDDTYWDAITGAGL